MKKIFMVVWLCIFSLSLYADDGFSFDDLEEVEKSEQSLLLQMAKEQARAYNFSKAQSLIKEAENKAYSPDELSSAKKVLASSQAKKRREDEERARQARLAEERRQREVARRNASSSGGNYSSSYDGSSNDKFAFSADCYGYCIVEKIELYNSSKWIPDNVSTANNIWVYEMSKGRGVAGTYRYNVTLQVGDWGSRRNRVCSGSFSTSGTKQYIKINLHFKDCSGDLSQY